jgi:uncharacterized protein YjiS (DUF1127 family)
MKHVEIETLSLRHTSEVNEAWIQEVIAEKPGILGLGDVVVRDMERRQPKAGRLDLLLQDPDTDKRYEVEIQLGATDESHIIRTIEYWDLERKRYPQYEHCAVIVAEDITSRFMNVISLFNGFIPLIAIQMTAIRTDDGIGLVFTKVLDEMALGLIDEDEESSPPANRDYWLDRGTEKTVKVVDKLLDIIQQFAPNYDLKYNKFYIGLAKDNIANNFVAFRPKKQWVNVLTRLPEGDEVLDQLKDIGLEPEYISRNGTYRIRLYPGHIEEYQEILQKVFKIAYEESQ